MRSLTERLVWVGGMIAVSAMAGCATNADSLRADGPSAVLHTSKSPEGFRDCMVGAAPSAVTATAFREGWMVSRTDTHPFVNFVEIVPEGSGARISVFGARGIRVSAERCV